MNELETKFCSDLLVEVGEKLMIEFNNNFLSRSIADMYKRFNKANEMASKNIQLELSKKFPQIQWADFEFDKSLEDRQSGLYWICDPIDGALNFLQGIPFWAISLCLMLDGTPQFSLVYDPCRKELFKAVFGQGTFLNEQRVQVSSIAKLDESILATSHPTFIREFEEDTLQIAYELKSLLPKAQAVRMMGAVSLQLAYVASGRMDAYWEHGFDLFDWWSGTMLVQEAGGIVTSIDGNPFSWDSKGVIATNSIFYPQLKKALSRCVVEN